MRAAVRDAFERAQVPLLARLVEQSSCTREPEDVEHAARIFDEAASALGLAIAVHPDPQGRYAAHRVYTTPATRDDDRALALVGHVDTVFPRAMGFAGFVREGDVARGPGVLDMKSGLTAMLFAIGAVRAAAPDVYARLRVRAVCVSDEEVGSPSSRALFASLAPRTSAALVFEAGRRGDLIVTRRRGGGLWTITAHGRASHAGHAHAAGVSAIHAMSLIVPRLEAITDHARGLTVNVGLFTGGSAKNTVPEHAEIGIDARFESARDAAELEARLRAIVDAPFEGLRDVPEKLSSVRFELGGGVTRPPMEASEASQALRLRYEACASRVGLGVGEAALQGGGSDANLLSAAGVPSIDGLGPWGEHFHETSEWSSLESLARRTEALALFLLDEIA
ncbi:M20/M25/M40 family metallo-hydrolase [Sandaracinus amylolyticus]|uniref:M20/M25/M40 family metallo-hydrolase n=1 Tax=Sandaracinus amylolyticus TaxID=927083 RepID=UPI001F185733|nr:M20/M25/M40 family metallo-hydrolase [Sandaracinus amylolyticus]UJR78859.1 Acetylornithine deacetylase/Succinyl-diaminopimelate desuccinylase [Sandaracinus amylolyticus]